MAFLSVELSERVPVSRPRHPPRADSFAILHCGLRKLTSFCCVGDGDAGCGGCSMALCLQLERHLLVPVQGTVWKTCHTGVSRSSGGLWSLPRGAGGSRGQPGQGGPPLPGELPAPAGQTPRTLLALSLCTSALCVHGVEMPPPEAGAQLWLITLKVICVPSLALLRAKRQLRTRRCFCSQCCQRPPEPGFLGDFHGSGRDLTPVAVWLQTARWWSPLCRSHLSPASILETGPISKAHLLCHYCASYGRKY